MPVPLQLILTQLISDHDLMTRFFKHNREQLRNSYQITTNTLTRLKIPFLPVHSGIYLKFKINHIITYRIPIAYQITKILSEFQLFIKL